MDKDESLYLLKTLDKLLNHMKDQNEIAAKQQSLEELRTMAAVRAVSQNVEFNAIVDAKLNDYMNRVISQEKTRSRMADIEKAFR